MISSNKVYLQWYSLDHANLRIYQSLHQNFSAKLDFYFMRKYFPRRFKNFKFSIFNIKWHFICSSSTIQMFHIISLTNFFKFLLTYLYEKDLYNQQNYALCSTELPCRDRYKLSKEVVLELSLVVDHIKSQLYPSIEKNSSQSEK